MTEIERKTVPEPRTRWNTDLTIIRVRGEGDRGIVDVFVMNWRSNHGATSFPLRYVPEELRGELTSGRHVIAQVNLVARRGRQLKPSNFQLYPPEAEFSE